MPKELWTKIAPKTGESNFSQTEGWRSIFSRDAEFRTELPAFDS
jgi:hypothetical protein